MGLRALAESVSHAVLATREGLEALAFEKGAETGLSRLSFEIDPALSLHEAKAILAEAGIAAEEVNDVSPGISRALRFTDPAGTEIDLFNAYDFTVGDMRHAIGIMPLQLGHVARFVADVPALTAFYCDTFGFRVSDWRTDVGAFLRCGPDHHTINMFKGEPRLAHLAFEVKDGAELHRACDVLALNGSKLDWGPSRHNIGHNIACYHLDANGHRVEIYTEMDQMKSEELGYFEPRPWHQERPQRPKIWPLETSKNYWGEWGAS
jgi:catechol 2,3-dioxygenase-like lactoylglutathione lyase family enzyme